MMLVLSSFSYAQEFSNKKNEFSLSIDIASLTFSKYTKRSNKWFLGYGFGIGLGIRHVIFSNSNHLSNNHNYEKFVNSGGNDYKGDITSSWIGDVIWVERVGSYRYSSWINLNVGLALGTGFHSGTKNENDDHLRFGNQIYFTNLFFNPEIGFNSIKIGTKIDFGYIHETGYEQDVLYDNGINDKITHNQAIDALALRWTPLIIRLLYRW